MRKVILFASAFFIAIISLGQVRYLTEALNSPLEVKHLKLKIEDNWNNLEDLLRLENLQILEVYVESGIQVNLPKTLFKLKDLKSISLQGTNISQIVFDNLDRFENLNELYVNDQTGNVVFPKSSGSLTRLILVLDNAKRIDNTIKNFHSLTSLSIGSNSVKSIDNSISMLKDLKYLRIHCDSLVSLPRTICEMKSIEEIDLYIKSDIGLPDEFHKLENLKEFRWGQSRRFPIEIYRCKSLERLTFDKSYFDSIPVGISSLLHLKELTLSSGAFKELPRDFGKLYSLVELALTGSEISVLPPDLSDLKSLKGVELKYCKNLTDAKSLIKSLKTVENLEWLIISDSGLTYEDQTTVKRELGLKN